MIRLCCLLVLLPSPAFAWNAVGHKVAADIAWQQLDPDARQKIVDTLRRHPRFDEDFAKRMPNDVDDARWTFQQAAIWPDIVRGFKGEDLATYHMPTWHYVNFPIFVGRSDRRPLIGPRSPPGCAPNGM